jgi:hypothetical protein
MTTLTPVQQASIAATVERMQLAKGLGDTENACSIAAINLALSGELTDEIPFCMSKVIGHWIIAIQDQMPDDMRNSSDWKRLLPLAAGTGRDHEPERLAMIVDWMWASLELAQPIADAGGFGLKWQAMCRERSATYAYAAATAATYAAATATYATVAATYAAATATYAAANTAAAATAAAAAAATDWQSINPPALLERLIKL